MKHIATIFFFLIISKAIFGQDANSFYASGKEKRNNGDYENAILDFNKAIELKADFIVAYEERGYSHSRLDQDSLALQDYNKALELGSQNPLVYLNRGWAKYNLGKKADACPDWEMAKQLGYLKVIPTINEYCK